MEMSGTAASSKPIKLCFVTIGATADFDALINAVLDPLFLECLSVAHYTHLRIQYGKMSSKHVFDVLDQSSNDKESTNGILVTGFDFKSDGLSADMSEARGDTDGFAQGCVISHAGSSPVGLISISRADLFSQALGRSSRPFASMLLS